MRATPFAVLLTLVALCAACGGSSSSTGTPTATVSHAIGSATVTTTQGTGKTVTPLRQTPSVAATARGETATAPPVSTEGTPAVQPSDQEAFLAQFQGMQVDLQSCEHTPGTAIVDCSGVLYAIDPPIVGQDIQCSLWLVAGTPRALGCSSAEPVQTTYYEIQ